MPNRLAGETSPYLLQHAHNPVDWYPWGPEALAKAKAEDKPIFLSIGYAACHWCHVMERESFEDAATAARPERRLRRDQGRPRGAARPRPGLHGRRPGDDRQGGWPMSVFLTPDGQPFYGGTYFPPEPHHGLPVLPAGPRRRRAGLARRAASRSWQPARSSSEALVRAEPPADRRRGDPTAGARRRGRRRAPAARSTRSTAPGAGRRSSPSR